MVAAVQNRRTHRQTHGWAGELKHECCNCTQGHASFVIELQGVYCSSWSRRRARGTGIRAAVSEPVSADHLIGVASS